MIVRSRALFSEYIAKWFRAPVLVILLSVTSVSGQSAYDSKDNYKGNWENSNTWVPSWTSPDTLISGLDVSIYGYVTRNGPLEFTGSTDYLRVRDTLVIFGNLSIKNNCKLVLYNNSVLIVRGNLLLGNTADIYSNSYLVVTGDFIKSGDPAKGSFYTNSPSNVFILGNVPTDLDPSRYPSLKCPSSTPYPHSGCGYGNAQDLAGSPIFPFFQKTCSPVVFTSSSSPLCVNESRTLSATPSGGTFSIVTGSATLSGKELTATAPGSLVIKYTEGAGCLGVGTQNLTVKPLPTPVLTITDNSGNAPNDGIVCSGDAVTLTASGGTSYIWSSGETTPSITKSSANTYTVTVTDANNCNSSVSKVVTVNSLPVVSVDITENSGILPNDGIICSGSTVNLTATGGTTYAWSTGETSPSVIKSSAGTYTVTVTDDNNCRNNGSATISVKSLPVAGVAITESSGTTINDGILCSGATATLTASGGTTYAWSTGETSPSVTKSSAGAYTVTVTDANNCQNNTNATISVNPLPVAGIAITENSGKTNDDGILCSGATATLTASGGTIYSWSTGETSPSVTKSSAGTYTVTVTDANNCQNSDNATISVNPLPVAGIAITESSGTTINDGVLCSGATATLTASGGTIYSWSTGETSPSVTKGSAGTYTVTVTDANNCQNNANVTLSVNLLPVAGIAITENSGKTNDDGILCSGATATLTASGGITYSWSTGETSPSLTKSSAGTYTVTVTEANNCQNNANAVITVNPLPVVGIVITESSGTTINDGVLCSGATATLTASGGTIYSWSTGETSPTVTKSSAGTYAVTMTDANNCENKANATISVNPLPVAGIAITENSGKTNDDGILCSGATAMLTASGGTIYSWSTGETSPLVTKSSAGTYTVTVTDANNCQNSGNATISVNSLPVAGIAITESSGKTNDDGILCSGATATLTASGGTIYSWSTGETSPSVTKSSAGTYTVTVTDANNCQNNANAVITVNPLPVVGIVITESSGTTNNDGILCSGAEAVLTASGALNYLWSTGEATSSIIRNSSGTFQVTATDENNCQNTGTATIEVKTLPSVTVSVTENSGKLANDGILCSGENATLTASAGMAYSWSTGETSQFITTGGAGTYSVTISDDNNCQNTAASVIKVNSIPPAVISFSDNSGTQPDDGIICNGESVKLVAAGGKTYAWSSGETSPEITKNKQGVYSVKVTDGNNCKSTASTTIIVNTLPDAVISVSETSGLISGDGVICSGTSARLSASGGAKYVWSTGETSSSLLISSPGIYTVTVTDENNCQNKKSTVIKVNPLPELNIRITENSGKLSADGIICYGDTAILTVQGNDTYQWSTGEKGSQIGVKETGTYILTATTDQGCVNTSEAVITTVKVIATAGNDTDVCGNQHPLNGETNTGTGKWTISKGPGPLSFIPDDNTPRAMVNSNSYGSYKLTWTVMKDNCIASSDVNISFHEFPAAEAGPDQELNYAFQTKLKAEIPVSGTGQWSLLSGSGNIYDTGSPDSEVFNLSEGENKFVWKVSSDVCSATDTVSVLVNDLFVPNVITPDGDNKNNFFVIADIEKNSPVELTIFNKWGNTVYRNNNYNNTWDGRSNENALLPDDTYFYVLKLANGKIIKSFVVIKR